MSIDGRSSAEPKFGASPVTGAGPSPLLGPVGMAAGLLYATGPSEAIPEVIPPRAEGLLKAAGPWEAIPEGVPKKGGGTAVSKKGSGALEASGPAGSRLSS